MHRCLFPHVLWNTCISLFQRTLVYFSHEVLEKCIFFFFFSPWTWLCQEYQFPISRGSLFGRWCDLNTNAELCQWSIFSHSVSQCHTCPVKLQWQGSSVYLLSADRKIVSDTRKTGWTVSLCFIPLESSWRPQLTGLNPLPENYQYTLNINLHCHINPKGRNGK